ncbi:MAG: biotin--[acetyl-CoA-carboxylase] ligase, partial [Kiloniellales bacterium]|nr:biotin--[acetyl-CoA-carboxylase] ligase [Kiloniellales bacterium]
MDRIFLPSGWRLYHFAELDSTNSEALRLLNSGEPEGAVVWADRQIAGRGRRGRHWESLEGNLLVSFLLRPAVSYREASQLGFVMAVAASDAISAVIPNVAVTLKWPNDILCGGRKTAGILLESAGRTNGGPLGVAVGLGLNIRSAPIRTPYPATCLDHEGAQLEDRPEDLLSSIAENLNARYQIWLRDGFGGVR